MLCILPLDLRLHQTRSDSYGAPGAWSQRITEEHRLVYLVDGEDLIILQVRYHY